MKGQLDKAGRAAGYAYLAGAAIGVARRAAVADRPGRVVRAADGRLDGILHVVREPLAVDLVDIARARVLHGRIVVDLRSAGRTVVSIGVLRNVNVGSDIVRVQRPRADIVIDVRRGGVPDICAARKQVLYPVARRHSPPWRVVVAREAAERLVQSPGVVHARAVLHQILIEELDEPDAVEVFLNVLAQPADLRALVIPGGAAVVVEPVRRPHADPASAKTRDADAARCRGRRAHYGGRAGEVARQEAALTRESNVGNSRVLEEHALDLLENTLQQRIVEAVSDAGRKVHAQLAIPQADAQRDDAGGYRRDEPGLGLRAGRPLNQSLDRGHHARRAIRDIAPHHNNSAVCIVEGYPGCASACR